MSATIQIKERHLEYAIHLINKKGMTVIGSTRTDEGYILRVDKVKLIWGKYHVM